MVGPDERDTERCLGTGCACISLEPATVRLATEDDRGEWDRFVDTAPDGTLFHRFAWSGVLHGAFGYEPLYLVAERAGAIVGLLPLVHKKSALFGNSVSSLPFCSYGGPLGANRAIGRSLVERGLTLAQDLNVDVIELRGETPPQHGWVERSHSYATFERTLASTPEAILKSIRHKGRRHAVRRSLQRGLTFERRDDISEFYTVLAESYRNLGTPVFPRRYFTLLKAAFPDEVSVHIARRGNTPLAASLAFAFRDGLHPVYAGGTAAARTFNANDFLFFNLMCTALEKGLSQFDFGRSKVGTGSFAYKKYWGYEPRPLTYHYKLVRGKQLPHLSPANPRYRRLVGAWKRLPLGVSRAIGPPLMRHLG